MTLFWVLGNLRVVGQSDFRHRSSKSFMHISHKFMHEYLPTDPKIHFPKMVSSLAVTCVICGQAHTINLGRVAAGGWRCANPRLATFRSAAGRQSESRDFSANPRSRTFRWRWDLRRAPIRAHGLFAGYFSVHMSPILITKCGQMLYHISAPLLDEYG